MTVEAAPRSLADVLRTWDDPALVELLRARPDLITPVPTDLAALAARAGSVPSAARVLDRLDRFSLDVVEALAVLAEPMSVAAVCDALPTAPRDDVMHVVDQCRTLALVFGPPEDLRLVRAVVDALGPSPAGLGPALAATHDRLAAILASPGGLTGLLIDAPDGARQALEQLAWGPPNGRVDNARRPLGDPAAARTPVDWLLAHELLVGVGPDSVVLPREVGLHLREGIVHREAQPDAPGIRTTDHGQDQVDQSAAAQAFTSVRLVETLLESWGLEPPTILRAGGLGVRELRRTAAALDVDERTAGLIIETAYAAALVGADGQLDEAYAPTPSYDLWLTRDTADRWATLAEAWLASNRVAGAVGDRDDRDKVMAALGPDLDRSAASEMRHVVLRELAALPPGAAADASSLVDRLDWLRPRRGGRRRSELIEWTMEEAELLGITGRGALSGPARALVSDDAHEAVRRLAPMLPQPLDHVLLQADLTAVAPGPLESGLAAELSLMADIESTGGATVFRFSPSSVRRALDAGRSAGDLHSMLAARSRTPVPQPLSYLIDDVARRHGQIRVGAASAYVRCDDEAVLSELVADRRSAPLRLRRLAPTVVAAQAPVDQVLNGLRTMGYAPAAESTDGSVVVRRPDTHRTPPRQRPPRLRTEPAIPGDTLLSAAVRAIRAGERASTAPRGRTVGAPLGGVLPRSTTAETLGTLKRAVDSGKSLWIGYVDTHGGVSDRVVDPIRLAGGYLTAFDHRLGEVHTFAVHRITGVAELDDDPGDNAGSEFSGRSDPDPEGVA